jgi:hypothetical protein
VGTAGPRRFLLDRVARASRRFRLRFALSAASGRLGYERVDVAGTSYLVVGGEVKKADTELYYFYSEERLWDELAQLRNVLSLPSGSSPSRRAGRCLAREAHSRSGRPGEPSGALAG